MGAFSLALVLGIVLAFVVPVGVASAQEGQTKVISVLTGLRPKGSQVGKVYVAPPQSNLRAANWTVDRAKSEQKTTTQTYKVSSANYDDSVAPLAAPDAFTADQCRAYFPDGDGGRYVIRNHYAICYVGYTTTDFVLCGSGSGECSVLGTTTSRVTITGTGGTGARKMIIDVFFDEWESEGQTSESSTRFNFDVLCSHLITTDTCEQSVPGGAEKTITGWKAAVQPQLTQSLLTTTPTPETGDRDSKGYYLFQPVLRNYATEPTYAPEQNFRCDNATSTAYIRYTGCTINNIRAVVQLDASAGSGVTESAQFIRDAQLDVTNNTRPGAAGTYVPNTLTRRYSGYDVDGLATKSRNKSTALCRAAKPTGYGPTYTTDREDGLTNDCDEYPLAATYEDSITIPFENSARTFAVRPVLSSDNQLAGNRIGRFTIDDHILDGDPYDVEIIGG